MLSPPNTCAEKNILDFMVLQRPSAERLQLERGAGEGHLCPICARMCRGKKEFFPCVEVGLDLWFACCISTSWVLLGISLTGNSHMDNCSRGVISIFCRAKSFVYCCDIFRISFGLARFGVPKIQNSVKEERGSMVQNCSNVEDVFLIFNLMKRIMLIVICCLH